MASLSHTGECNLYGASSSSNGPKVKTLRGHDPHHQPPVQRQRQFQHHHRQLRRDDRRVKGGHRLHLLSDGGRGKSVLKSQKKKMSL